MKKKRKRIRTRYFIFDFKSKQKRVMVGFPTIMLALWCIPIYSLLKDSRKYMVLKITGISFDKSGKRSSVLSVFYYPIINAVCASALLVLDLFICRFCFFQD